MTIDDATLDRLALQCENEDLRRCGTIMPHGVLARVDARDQSISHVSENVEAMLGKTASQLLGRPFLECGLPIVLSVDDQRRQPGARTEYAALDAGVQGKLDAVVTVVEAGWLIECRAARADAIDKAMLARYHKELSVAILDDAEIVTLADALARAFEDVAGFTRAMVYRFQDDWSGNVIAESSADGVKAYLNLRFPASDIPKVARDLYLLNAYRHLPNPSAPQVPVISRGDAPLDLSYSDFRSASPLHVKYLENMGVTTSFSVPIKVEKALWGMLTCHHASPEPLSRAAIEACVGLARRYSETLTNFLVGRRLSTLQRVEDATIALGRAIERSGDLPGSLAEQGLPLSEILAADGFAVVHNGQQAGIGKLPTADVIDEIDRWFTSADREMLSSSNLAAVLPGAARFAASASGLYALRIHAARFYWFRQESAQKVEWAGEPMKSVVGSGSEQMLTPRASFQRWVEIKVGHSDPWRNEQRMVVAKVRDTAKEWPWLI